MLAYFTRQCKGISIGSRVNACKGCQMLIFTHIGHTTQFSSSLCCIFCLCPRQPTIIAPELYYFQAPLGLHHALSRTHRHQRSPQCPWPSVMPWLACRSSSKGSPHHSVSFSLSDGTIRLLLPPVPLILRLAHSVSSDPGALGFMTWI